MKKLTCILLVAVMLASMLVGCSSKEPEARVIDTDFVVVYENTAVARTAASNLASGLRPLLGGVMKTECCTDFSGDLETGKYIFLGETGLVPDLPALDSGYSVTLQNEGLCIRGADEDQLVLAVSQVIELWGSSEECGLREGQLWINVEIAAKLNVPPEEKQEEPEEIDPRVLTVMSQNVLIGGDGYESATQRSVYLKGLIEKPLASHSAEYSKQAMPSSSRASVPTCLSPRKISRLPTSTALSIDDLLNRAIGTFAEQGV